MIYVILYDLIFYVKYFIYFNLFIVILINNIIYYKLFNKSNYYLVQSLYYIIKLNGCVLIKIVQWINNNSEMLNVKNNYIELFDNFYENNNIHSINYTKKIFKNDFNYNFDEIIELDLDFKVKSGSVAQVYKGKFKNADKLLKRSISLPLYENLSNSQIEYVCDNVKKFFRFIVM